LHKIKRYIIRFGAFLYSEALPEISNVIIFNEAEKFHVFPISAAMYKPTENETEKHQVFPVSTSVLLTAICFSFQFPFVISKGTPQSATDSSLRSHHLVPSNFHNFPTRLLSFHAFLVFSTDLAVLIIRHPKSQ
jgi:hypothetical protein